MLIKRQVAHFPVVERYAVAIKAAMGLFSPHSVSDHSFFVFAVDCAQDEQQHGYCLDRRHGLILRRLVQRVVERLVVQRDVKVILQAVVHRDGNELDKVQVAAVVVEAGEREIVTEFTVVVRAAMSDKEPSRNSAFSLAVVRS